MCNNTNCEEVFVNQITSSKESLYCAFFDFDLEKLHDTIKNRPVKKLIYVDSDNKHFNDSFTIYQQKSSFMHHKFCIIDHSITITGSFNPTINGNNKNDNNIVLIKSEEVAEHYLSYFKDIIQLDNTYKKTRNKEIQNKSVKICFTPQENCLKLIRNEISKANHSIKAMLFTMTDKTITNLLLFKKAEGIEINMIFEKSLITKYSSYHKLLFQDTTICKDKNKGKLHHKVFIIDNKTIITGSMNPSKNAQKRNDENVVVINNKEIAENYLNEFLRIQQLCMT